MNSIVDVKNLSFSYAGQPVLKNLGFSVEKGSFFIIIGPNGSGKTTLMKIMSGILKSGPDKIKISGKSARAYSRKAMAKIISFVPQTAPVDFPFKVKELVLMGRSPHLGILGMEQKKDIELVEEALVFTNTQHLAERKIDQLSGGERQRVFIARAICQEPKIIMLDEPTASLDIAHQLNIMDLMEKLKFERDVTVLMVSHDINLAAMYADKILLLNNGEKAGFGPPEDILKFDTLEKTYGCRLLVDQSPFGNFPRITPVPQKFMNL